MEICKHRAEMPYLPDISATAHHGMGGTPTFFGSAFETLMLSLDLIGLQISFQSLAVESWPGSAFPIRMFLARRPQEVDSIISGNCSTCWPVNKTNC
jgi:hypothetical protein